MNIQRRALKLEVSLRARTILITCHALVEIDVNVKAKTCSSLANMSYLLPHLPSGWHVDEAIKSEEDRVVVIRFGHDWDTQCMTMDETLFGIAEKVQNFAVIYLVDITEVPDFNKVREFVNS
ncbi:Thioredoxin-like 4A [Arthromyces matolae]|nr:Thioredoxin-like 4A [Arthromyces matolae]